MISWVSVMGMNKLLGRRLPDGLSEEVHFYRSQLEKKVARLREIGREQL